MIFEEIAEAQVARLSGTEYYQQRTPEALSDLIDVLRVMADDANEAEAAITLWLNSERGCPTVADLRATFAELREGKPQPATSNAFAFSHGCPLCHGTGRMLVYQLCTGTIGNVLAQDLPGGYAEAEAIRDCWAQERRDWLAANPTGCYKPVRNQYIGESAKKCGCGR